MHVHLLFAVVATGIRSFFRFEIQHCVTFNLASHVSRGSFASFLCSRYSYPAGGFVRPQGDPLQFRKLGSIVLASSFAVTMAAGYSLAQDVAHDVDHVAKDTAHGTKVAAKDTVHGTKVAAKDTAHGTKVAAKDTAHGTEKAGDKIAGKPIPQ